MSMIVRHKIKGLYAWQQLKYPNINCRLGSSGLYVWHRGELRIVSLQTFEVTRTISIPDQIISFIEVFYSFCYIVGQNSAGSSVQSFNTDSCLMFNFQIAKEQIVSIEHIDSLSYIAGTESCRVLWVEKGVLMGNYKVMETESPIVLSLRVFILNEENHVACGLGNGQVKIVKYNGIIDSLPRLEDTGKIVGIERMNYNKKDYFVLFSESPACLKVVAQSDEQSDSYEEFSACLEENVSLLQMSCYEETCVFILTLRTSVLTLYCYSGGRQLDTIYQSEMNLFNLKDVVCFGIPEHSLFHYRKESGCDLCMVVNGCTEIQTINITSSHMEKISSEISENCAETSIWQKPEFLTKVIRDLSDIEEAKFIDSNYTTEDLKVIDILVGLEKSSLICDFLLRQAGNNYVLPEDYVDLIHSWLDSEIKLKERSLFERIIPDLIQGQDIDENIETLKKFRGVFFEYEKIENALKKRTQVIVSEKKVNRLAFIIKVLIWIHLNKENADVVGLDWDNHRRALSGLIGNWRGTLYLQGLAIDQWGKELPNDLQSVIYSPLTDESIYKLLVETDKKTFCKFFLYFLLELSHGSLENQEIIDSFISEFLISNSEFHFIRGHWCLDSMVHPKVVPIDNRNQLQKYASDALHELAKVADLLKTDEKLAILIFFSIIPAFEQAVHWILVSDMDFNQEDCIESIMLVIFSGSEHADTEYEWVRAYSLISLLKDQVPNPDLFMKIFSEQMQNIGKGHKLPSISFDPDLQKSFLSNLPLEPSIKFFTFFANQQYEKAFTEGHINFPQLFEAFKHCIKYKKDYPNARHYVDYKPSIDDLGLNSLNLQDKPVLNSSKCSENFLSSVFN